MLLSNAYRTAYIRRYRFALNKMATEHVLPRDDAECKNSQILIYRKIKLYGRIGARVAMTHRPMKEGESIQRIFQN